MAIEAAMKAPNEARISLTLSNPTTDAVARW